MDIKRPAIVLFLYVLCSIILAYLKCPILIYILGLEYLRNYEYSPTCINLHSHEPSGNQKAGKRRPYAGCSPAVLRSLAFILQNALLPVLLQNNPYNLPQWISACASCCSTGALLGTPPPRARPGPRSGRTAPYAPR